MGRPPSTIPPPPEFSGWRAVVAVVVLWLWAALCVWWASSGKL